MRGFLVMAMFAASLAGAGSADVGPGRANTGIAAGPASAVEQHDAGYPRAAVSRRQFHAMQAGSKAGHKALVLARERKPTSNGC